MAEEQQYQVTFEPSHRSTFALAGSNLLEVAARAGIPFATPCGGGGTCGKCRVRLLAGGGSPSDDEIRVLGGTDAGQGFRLACQFRVEGNLTVEIPPSGTAAGKHRILTSHADGWELKKSSRICRKHFRLPPPTLLDPVSDLARLRRVLGEVQAEHDVLRALPVFLRAQAWEGTAVLHGSRLTGLEPGDTGTQCLGACFDIGTTTVVGVLLDLHTGTELAIVSRLNPQIMFGDDVIARIQKVRENPEFLKALHTVIAECVDGMLKALCREAGVPPERVGELVVAGNTTMQQIFCGFTPAPLGEVPFAPVFETGQDFPAAALGLGAGPGALVHVYGQIGGFVGGDTLAGMVASRLDSLTRPTLLVDIGTNGEIVLVHEGKMSATSTAAGPAFEGARIRQGMRAMAGAIERVVIEGDVRLGVIGNTAPVGFCGTGLIDACAELLRCHLVDMTGRLQSAGEAAGAGVPPALAARLVEREGQPAFVFSAAAGADPEVCLTQKDLRELQLAKGAVRAGIDILVKRAGIGITDLDRILLAGAFGNYIRPQNAMRIGLLPPLPLARVSFIGNAALLGARMALLSLEEREYAESMRRRTEHVDLSADPEFQMEFGMAMMFPLEEDIAAAFENTSG